ncbi:metallophosphoesterase [Pseudenhygromyxa sp. WMMC2535]|uniref:metallophosphoesterase n=1 Tax=Pseudenhygromyxa sp. WMMC2535 TaxID=2712867 RepID=UPI0015534BA3|nr:metallophosphoesterase [Pseudenhygromyxa sp. WMMC2535]NVB36210.1 metallophosphoesterase [Pseudenhygromyxa sp. WMMC2535]NVB43409.1 metallophosphoesterase [Pseudenhygromyxa sp. WMMC2535]
MRARPQARALFRASFVVLSAVSSLALACTKPPAAHELDAQRDASAVRKVSIEDAPGPSLAGKGEGEGAGGAAAAGAAAEGVGSQAAEILPGELPAAKSRYDAPARLVAIGDVHGDLEATRRALRLAGAIDGEDHWIGGELVLVQTGDQLDRGDGEQAILELLARLQHEAEAAGGAVHLLNGNHEYMNALGDLRYVTPGGFEDFEDAPGVDPEDPRLAAVMARVPEEARARVAAFMPGMPWALELAKRNTILVVGDSAFVHGGVLPDYARRFEAVNADGQAFLRGELREPPKAIIDPDGPVWSRHYSDQPDEADCALLDEALDALGVARMIVGHTVHKEGIGSACDGKVWMIDVGMAAYYGGPLQVLELRGGELEVLREG